MALKNIALNLEKKNNLAVFILYLKYSDFKICYTKLCTLALLQKLIYEY